MLLGTAGCIQMRGGRAAGGTPNHRTQSVTTRSAGGVDFAVRPPMPGAELILACPADITWETKVHCDFGTQIDFQAPA
jgi:hypothetical protein